MFIHRKKAMQEGLLLLFSWLAKKLARSTQSILALYFLPIAARDAKSHTARATPSHASSRKMALMVAL